MIEIPLLQGKMLYFQLLAGSFILNKNLTKVLNFIFSNSTTSWSTEPKVAILGHIIAGMLGAALGLGRHRL